MIIDQLPEITDANDSDEMPIEQGTTTRKIKILNLLKGVVSKAGGTITGGLAILGYLAIQRSSGNAIAIDDLADDSTVSPSSTRNGITLSFRDKNGVSLGSLRARHTASSYKGLYLYGNNSSAPSGSQTNGLYLMVNDSGEKLVTLSDPAAWLTALGLDPVSTSVVSNIVSAGTGMTISSADFVQFGKVAQLRIVWSKSTAVASGNTTIGALVSGKRPAFNTFATMHTNHDLVAYINANGNVVANGPITANTNYTLYSTFILS